MSLAALQDSTCLATVMLPNLKHFSFLVMGIQTLSTAFLSEIQPIGLPFFTSPVSCITGLIQPAKKGEPDQEEERIVSEEMEEKRKRRREMLRCEQPVVREVHAELSVNEGGCGRGRGENRNAESRSRLRLSMPSERTRRFSVSRILISPFR